MTATAARPTGTMSDLQVLFDWNGTMVLDTERARRATNRVLGRRNLPTLDEAAFVRTFRLPLGAMFGDLGVPQPDRGAAEQEWNAEMAAGTAQVRTGTTSMLQQLRDRGALLGVVSAASADTVMADISDQEVAGLLDSVLTGVTDKATALRALRDRCVRAAYVGDTEYDIECALTAGFLPIGIAGGYCDRDRLAAAGAVTVIDEMTELVPLLEGVWPAR